MVRDGFVYTKSKRLKGGKIMYMCEDYDWLGCRGRWIVYPMQSGGDFGELYWEHNIPPDMHKCNLTDLSALGEPTH